MANTKVIEIGNKKYTLTATRSLIQTVYNLMPELFNQVEGKSNADITKDMGKNIEFYVKLGSIFYELIKVAHPELDKSKAENILAEMENEYEDADTAIINFALSSFTQGAQDHKKKLNW